MAFWGVEVKPGKPFTLKATNDATGIKRLHISQATLGLGIELTSRSILQCKVRNKDPLFLCVLYPLKVDSCQLNLEFEEAEDVIFSVYGPMSVHLTGYFLGRSSNAFRLNDDESESYGEDIADTDGEKSSSDDYDYGDSFIDDNDPYALGSDVPSIDDDEITIKERAAKTKEKKQNKKGGEGTSARADDCASEDSVKMLNNDNDHKIPKVFSSEVPLPSRVTSSKARSSTLENGETDAKCEKTSEATTDTDKTLDKREDKNSSEVVSKKKRNKESESLSESQKPPSDKAIESSTDVLPSQNGDKAIESSIDVLPSQNGDKAIESSTDVLPSEDGEATPSKKKRKRDRKEDTKELKKQAIDNAENTEKEFGTKKLPENSSDEVKIEEIEKGKVDGKVAVQGKNVSILYIAKLKDTGNLIESNLDEGPFEFRLGEEKVIKGLSIGVEGMRVGDKRRLIIPPSLGYSEERLKKESVPKNAWLVYEVEAVKVQ